MSIAEALANAQARLGQEIAVSDWVQVTQDKIDAFAETTGDRQWIHIDPARAAQTPFGGTIAHGFLTLSLASQFAQSSLPQAQGAVMGINYGFDRLRFLTPVKAGAWLRGRFTLQAVSQRKPLELLRTHALTVEIRDGKTPALVGTWLGLTIFAE